MKTVVGLICSKCGCNTAQVDEEVIMKVKENNKLEVSFMFHCLNCEHTFYNQADMNINLQKF